MAWGKVFGVACAGENRKLDYMKQATHFIGRRCGSHAMAVGVMRASAGWCPRRKVIQNSWTAKLRRGKGTCCWNTLEGCARNRGCPPPVGVRARRKGGQGLLGLHQLCFGPK